MSSRTVLFTIWLQKICRGISRLCKNGNELVLVGLYGSQLIEAAKKVGIPYACEVFADRAYNDDGSLVSRSLPNAVIHNEEEAVSRSVRMVRDGIVTSVSGKEIPVQADTICVHGDNPSAIAFVQKIRAALASENIEISHL